jgi:hypothetical protein
MRSMICCRWPTSGCTAICTARSTTAAAAAAVVANPLGYARKGEQEGFLPELLITIGD